ncbi:Protein N-acetyltransferase, RimJ/RimL family [Halogranum gelatinilyticum]|uniref:Protein N-acetyltransferase, RimJ/RimL family n=1 Tax=Halogranum gelatinilyticum TaxID=660521 RepID=A0A1G9W6A6_9EURY|nr:GNAT family protein [Halogranum gelatinilyticum]SDM80058.1 Protein N-acetyltransferase, RimJ/RimL family [Halogranum gelatinilyticum]
MADTTVVSSERVSLRPVERDDAEFMQRSTTDPEIRVPLGSTQPSNSHQSETFIEETLEGGDGVSLVVETDDESIGLVAVKSLDQARPELVYWLVPEYHGEGYGSEAVGLFVDYLFRTHDCRGLHARVFDFNDGSQDVVRGLGFTEEGRFREARFVDGDYVDVVHFGLLRREWQAR